MKDTLDPPLPFARFWDRHAAKYARKPVADEHAYAQTLDRVRAHLPPRARVLELGCGTGTTALKLAGGVEELLATDYSGEMIAIATEKARAAGVSHVHFRRCTLDDPSLAERPYDVVLAMNLLHLFEELPLRLRRIHELVAPGGLFISKTPCIGDMGIGLRLVLPVMRALGLAPHVSFVTERSLGEALAAGGFELVETGMYPQKGRSFFVVARKT